MKNTFHPLSRLAVFAAAAIAMSTSAFAGQPRMQAALQSLLAARAELEQASANKGGERIAAIQAIDRAISHIQAGKAYARKH